ncbi:MAG: hypothetical protein FWF69_01765 [Firmicutes bacterium]|nr:hypothetical protein [Bacillota bacterium]
MKDDFTDIHHHLMYGMDDGPATLQEAQAMVRAAGEDGIRKLVVTPHVAPGRARFEYGLFLERLERLKDCAGREGVVLKPGAEIFFTEATVRHLRDQRVPTLADTRYVLVEFSPDIPYPEMLVAAESLLIGGYIPFLAHIERYQCLVSRPQRVLELKRQLSARCQINCSTVVQGRGFTVNRFCRKLLEDGLIDAVATDAHNVGSRPVMMSAAYRVLTKRFGLAYARYLTGAGGGVFS